MLKKYDFLGVYFSVVNQAMAKDLLLNYVPTSGYVCFPDASVVTMANQDPLLLKILNRSLITFPDGKPSQLVANLRGYKDVSTVSGFNLCKSLLDSDKSHYFYGADNSTLDRMIQQIMFEFPNSIIKGSKSPPYLKINEISNNEEIKNDILNIASLNPDFVWIGISSPKQDYIMYFFHQFLPNSIMIGVGGVFLYLADPYMKSPEWIKKIGMRWLYRLIKEPGRLNSKYRATLFFLIKNSGYFLSLVKDRIIGKRII